MAGWLDGWMAGWLAGWLADWMAGWLDGWLALICTAPSHPVCRLFLVQSPSLPLPPPPPPSPQPLSPLLFPSELLSPLLPPPMPANHPVSQPPLQSPIALFIIPSSLHRLLSFFTLGPHTGPIPGLTSQGRPSPFLSSLLPWPFSFASSSASLKGS